MHERLSSLEVISNLPSPGAHRAPLERERERGLRENRPLFPPPLLASGHDMMRGKKFLRADRGGPRSKERGRGIRRKKDALESLPPLFQIFTLFRRWPNAKRVLLGGPLPL